MNNEATAVNNNESPQKSKRSCGCCCFGCLFMAVVILAGGLFGAWLVFSFPQKFYAEPLTVNETVTQSIIISQIINQISEAETPTDYQEITLSEEQLNTLCKVILNSAAVADAFGRHELDIRPQDFTVNYQKSGFSGKYSLDVEQRWLFGGNVMLTAIAQPYLNADGEGVKVSSATLGKLPIPVSVVESFAAGALDELRKDEMYAQYRPAVREIKVEPDFSIIIGYYPYYFKKFIPDLEKLLLPQQ